MSGVPGTPTATPVSNGALGLCLRGMAPRLPALLACALVGSACTMVEVIQVDGSGDVGEGDDFALGSETGGFVPDETDTASDESTDEGAATIDDGAETFTTDTTDDTSSDGGSGENFECSASNPGWEIAASVGLATPHFGGVNQHGDNVSICAYEGLPIVIDTSAVWCGPCGNQSACLSGDDDACLDFFNSDQIDNLIQPLRDAVADDAIAWVTVLLQNGSGGVPDNNDAVTWASQYPNEKIWVIADELQLYPGHVPLMQFPSLWLIDTDMRWEQLDQGYVWSTIAGKL